MRIPFLITVSSSGGDGLLLFLLPLLLLLLLLGGDGWGRRGLRCGGSPEGRCQGGPRQNWEIQV